MAVSSHPAILHPAGEGGRASGGSFSRQPPRRTDLTLSLHHSLHISTLSLISTLAPTHPRLPLDFSTSDSHSLTLAYLSISPPPILAHRPSPSSRLSLTDPRLPSRLPSYCLNSPFVLPIPFHVYPLDCM